jgi:acyl carrier protein
MSQEATEGAIREILATHGRLNAPVADIRPDADLFAIGLDSQAVVNVMLAIEERFDFEFPEDRLNRETFTTIGSISQVVANAGASV